MREAMKIYGGNTSVAPTTDDVEQATTVFREELSVLNNLFSGYDLKTFLNPDGDPFERYKLLAKAAEYVFASTQELQSESNSGKSVKTVSFKTYFLKTVKRMRMAFDVCQPSGELGDEESALAQCYMAIAGFVRKMSGTTEVDTETMNRHVSKMVEEALQYNKVESVLSEANKKIFSALNTLKNCPMLNCRHLSWNCLSRYLESKLQNTAKRIRWKQRSFRKCSKKRLRNITSAASI